MEATGFPQPGGGMAALSHILGAGGELLNAASLHARDSSELSAQNTLCELRAGLTSTRL